MEDRRLEASNGVALCALMASSRRRLRAGSDVGVVSLYLKDGPSVRSNGYHHVLIPIWTTLLARQRALLHPFDF